MAGYGNPGMYEDGPDQSMGGASPETSKPEMEHEDESGPEAVLPIEMLAGKKFDVGDSIVLKITRIGDKDVSVVYDYEGTKDEHGERGGGEAEMPEGMGMGAGNSGGGGSGMYD